MSCPDCFSGHVHSGLPLGREAKIHGLDTYIAEPKTSPAKGIIVVIPDAFGWQFVNNRILADHYASRGNYKVYLPDFMNGTAPPIWVMDYMSKIMDTSSIWAWILKPYYLTHAMFAMVPFLYYNRPGLSWPKVREFFDVLRSEDPSIALGAAGFCWGGKHAILLAHDESRAAGKPLIDAAFVGHPSFLKLPADIEKVKLPLSIAVGEHDMVLNAVAVKQVEGMLKKLEDVRSEVVVYKDAGHGFCVRADAQREDVLEQSEKAEEQAITWFSKQFELAGY